MTVLRSRPTRPSPRLLDGITILLAEDDADARRITCAMLRNQGAGVVVARDGLEALQLLRTTWPDIALLDLLMPELDGFGLVKRLRADPRWRRLPVIAVTALGSQADYLHTWELDFSAHLTKPVDDVVLASTVLRALGRGSSVRDSNRAPLAEVFRNAETALRTAANTVSDQPVRRALTTAAALTRQAGRAMLAQSVGQEGSSILRHTVRGTLNVIMGWSRILQAKREDEAEVLRAVEVIERNARSLARVFEQTGAER